LNTLNLNYYAMKNMKAGSIDEYIASFPANIQKILTAIRGTVKKAAPGAVEAIKYDMPTFVLGDNLVHFAAFKNHIGFYPVPRDVEEFQKELSAFDGDKSTLKIPLDSPPPLALLERIVKFRVKSFEKKKEK
jgi:uncharacterized protein YdhG (YjbR/CyaY superfamily)